jgi:hypothetical protein
MIRTNLSTRPFYNTRAVGLWLGLLVLVVIAATAANAVWIFQHSRSDSSLARQATADAERAAALRSEAARLRASVDTGQVERVSAEARLANDLIDRRVFSWTELFNLFERTLPAGVRVTAVRPSVDREGRILLTIAIVARAVDDVGEFMAKLEETGAFRDLLSRQELVNDQQLLEASLETFYVPVAAEAAP